MKFAKLVKKSNSMLLYQDFIFRISFLIRNGLSFHNFTRKISFGFLIRINSIISSENFQKKNFTRDPNSDFGVIISFWISSEILQNQDFQFQNFQLLLQKFLVDLDFGAALQTFSNFGTFFLARNSQLGFLARVKNLISEFHSL